MLKYIILRKYKHFLFNIFNYFLYNKKNLILYLNDYIKMLFNRLFIYRDLMKTIY